AAADDRGGAPRAVGIGADVLAVRPGSSQQRLELGARRVGAHAEEARLGPLPVAGALGPGDAARHGQHREERCDAHLPRAPAGHRDAPSNGRAAPIPAAAVDLDPASVRICTVIARAPSEVTQRLRASLARAIRLCSGGVTIRPHPTGASNGAPAPLLLLPL